MIDTSEEQVYRLKDFAAELKKQRKLSWSVSQIRSWVQKGFSPYGRKEPVVRLEAIRIGGAYYTSMESFDRFLREQNSAKMEAEWAS